MLDFWYQKFQEILTQENLSEAIATVYIRNFTLEEITAINQSADPVAQVASPALGKEVEAAIIAIADQYLTDETWVNNTAVEMLNSLSFLIEQYEPET